MSQLDTRRRLLRIKGRPMTLRRPIGADDTVSNVDLTVQGYKASFAPDQLIGDLRQGDARVILLNDEIVAAGWPGPPRANDVVLMDGEQWGVIGATALYEAERCIGHVLVVRGGL